MSVEEVLDINSLGFKEMSFAYEGSEEMFSNVSADLPMNQVVLVKGGGGSGKSTLLKMLAGILEPTRGTLMVNGQALEQMSFEDFLPYRLNIGYSFDSGGLLNNRTLFDNLMLPLLYHSLEPPSVAKERVERLMERFGLTASGDSRPSAVSGSIRKLACVLRSFVMRPQVLILDDPTTGLNAATICLVKEHIQEELASGRLCHVYIGSDDYRLLDGLMNAEVTIQEKSLIIGSSSSEFSGTPFRKVAQG